MKILWVRLITQYLTGAALGSILVYEGVPFVVAYLFAGFIVGLLSDYLGYPVVGLK